MGSAGYRQGQEGAGAFATVKAQVSLRDFADTHLEHRRGSTYVCPVCGSGTHERGTAAMNVNSTPDGELWHCFSCDAGGDVFDLAGAVTGTDDRAEQLAYVCDWARIPVPEGAPRPRTGQGGPVARKAAPAPAPAPEARPEPSEREALAAFRERERAYIERARAAMPGSAGELWMRARGFTDREIERARLGYDPDAGAIVIPWDADGTHLHTDRDITGRARSKYRFLGGRVPEGVREGLRDKKVAYGASALAFAIVWIVEGIFDALSMNGAGAHAMAIDGVAASVALAALEEASYQGCVICALDHDFDARGRSIKGREANERLAETLAAAGYTVLRDDEVDGGRGLPGGAKDANEAFTADREALADYVAAAEKEAVHIIGARAASALSESLARLRIVDAARTADDAAALAHPVMPVSSGLTELDRVLDGGVYPGVYTLGAVSSFGKTTLMVQMADYMAAHGAPVLFITIEQSADEIVRKSLSRIMWELSGRAPDGIVGTRDLMRPDVRAAWDDGVRARLERARERYVGEISANMSIMEADHQPSTEDIAEAARLIADHCGKAPVVFIDYLQLIAHGNDRWSDKQAVDANVMRLRQISRDMRMPIISASSLNRSSYSGVISLDSFKESGAIEYGSDVLLGMQPYGIEERAGDDAADVVNELKSRVVRPTEVRVLKQREGAARGVAAITYHCVANAFTDGVEVARVPRPRQTFKV